ncbi:hypothetical protein [Paracoccus sp. (in: a-proteobacteria)]|uniref:hypothetical protein n=1 Tax=Paracoccus sp. TaxID=267 RepID=UPI0026DFFCDF|nr:hypothetical protein [Paracoccus sp. (in: a-proteobacteria)]MDO5647357.1 hypothetical protein [Paracoccus sp. (in: a-proteobacteria)]
MSVSYIRPAPVRLTTGWYIDTDGGLTAYTACTGHGTVSRDPLCLDTLLDDLEADIDAVTNGHEQNLTAPWYDLIEFFRDAADKLEAKLHGAD